MAENKPFWKSPVTMTLIVAGVSVVGGVVMCLSMYVSYNNREVALRHQAEAVQIDLHNQLDNTTKKISQTAQVSQKQMESIKDIIIGNAQARGGSRGSLVTVLTESVPNLDNQSQTFMNLQNIIAGSRDSYASAQTRLLDIKREHDNLREQLPSSLFIGGRKAIEVKIVTSTKTEKAFESGVDDETEVFKEKK